MDRPPPMMASLTPIDSKQASLMQALRKGYQVYCASQSVPILSIILNELGDHVLEQEVKDIYNRLVQKGVPGLHHAAHAVLLFAIFECISSAGQIDPLLIQRFHTLLSGLEQRFDYMPMHCGSNNAVYNHIHGLFSSCIIAVEAMLLTDLTRILRSSEPNDVVLQGFEQWMAMSQAVSNYGTHPAFNNAVRDAVRNFLSNATKAQPHILISVMIAVEQWAVYASIAGHMAAFRVRIDLDPRNQQLYNEALPVPVPASLANLQVTAPTQRAVFVAPGSQYPSQVLPPVPAPPAQNQSGRPPSFFLGSDSVQDQHREHGGGTPFSPASLRDFQPRRTASLAQHGGRHQGLLAAHLAEYAQRRASTPHVKALLDSGADMNAALTSRRGSRLPPAPPSKPLGKSDTIKLAKRRSRSNFAELIADDGDNEQSQSSVHQQPASKSGPKPSQPRGKRLPSPPRPAPEDPASSSRSSTRRRSAAPAREQIKYDQDSDEEDEDEEDLKMAVPDDDPNDGDFVG